MRRYLSLLCATFVFLVGLAPAALAQDSDHDGMPDRWERAHGLDPHRANADGDPDHDGITNVNEFDHRTEPRAQDTDRDGSDDGQEINVFMTDPKDPDTDDDDTYDGNEDSDSDGTWDEDEDDAGTPASMTRAENREDVDDLTEPGVEGRATSSPSCPVERQGDPNCRPRPLEDASIVVQDREGNEVARRSTPTDGWFTFELPAGKYTLVGEPYGDSSLPSPPAPVDFTVSSSDSLPHVINLDYDSGIR